MDKSQKEAKAKAEYYSSIAGFKDAIYMKIARCDIDCSSFADATRYISDILYLMDYELVILKKKMAQISLET